MLNVDKKKAECTRTFEDRGKKINTNEVFTVSVLNGHKGGHLIYCIDATYSS